MKTKNDMGGRVGSPGGPGCGQRPLSRLSLQAPGPPASGGAALCPAAGAGGPCVYLSPFIYCPCSRRRDLGAARSEFLFLVSTLFRGHDLWHISLSVPQFPVKS